ncbi:MAG TPA: hypothetical protein VFZ61_07610 [Polyangiales bacterium]
MATVVQLAPTAALRATPHTAQRSAVPDQGPWLFLAAPFSFTLVLLTIVYLANLSF